MKKTKEIEVELILTEGWQERFTKASFNLYSRLERNETMDNIIMKLEAS